MNPKKRPAIGVMIGGAHSYFPREMIRGVSEQAQKEDVNVFFFLRIHTKQFFSGILRDLSSNAYDYQFNTLHDYCQLGGMDGLLIGYGTIGFHLQLDNPELFIRKYSNIPMMIVTEKVDFPNCYSIIADNYHSMFELVEHLIVEHGCRRILFMGGPDRNTDARERLEGYLAAMAKHGLPVWDSMIGHGDFSAYCEKQVEQVLDLYPDADAFVFANDEMASGGYRVFKRRGLRIGSDIKVTGFDGTDLSAKMDPPLTTLFQDAAGMSSQAIHDLVQILSGKTIQETRFPAPMVRRESCGCSRKAEQDSAEPIDYESELKKARAEIAQRQRELNEYQGKSWFLPLMARELNEIVEDEARFCEVALEKLRMLNANSAYLFLLDKPVTYDGTSPWECPDNLYLVSSCRKGVITSFPTYKRPRVTRELGIAQLTDDGDRHQYTVFLLFSGDRQYGLLVCDVPKDELSFFYVVSLQLGLSLQHFELSRIEAIRRRQLAQDIQQMEARNRELDMLSAYDELTGLLNLRGMTEQVKRQAASGLLKKGFIAYCDLDHLKEINDTFGHAEGNYALRTCAQILSSCLREGDILARIGGDEFMCVIPSDNDTFPETLRRRLRDTLHRMNEESEKSYNVEISIGISSFDAATYPALQAAAMDADKKLYEAKKQRRTSVLRTS